MNLTDSAWDEQDPGHDRYGAGSRDWAAAPDRYSGFAITGTVFGVLGLLSLCVIAQFSLLFIAAAFAFGVAGVIQVRRRLRRGMALAVTPLVLVAVWAAIIGLGLGALLLRS